MSPQLNSLNSELSSQENTRKNIQEALDIRRIEYDLKQKWQQIEEQKATLDETYGGDNEMVVDADVDLHDQQAVLERKIERSNSEKAKYLKDIHTKEGRVMVLKEQVNNLKSKLNSRDYKGVEKRWRDASIKFETVEMGVKDLATYYTAIDQSLQMYHTMKIKEINKVRQTLGLGLGLALYILACNSLSQDPCTLTCVSVSFHPLSPPSIPLDHP